MGTPLRSRIFDADGRPAPWLVHWLVFWVAVLVVLWALQAASGDVDWVEAALLPVVVGGTGRWLWLKWRGGKLRR